MFATSKPPGFCQKDHQPGSLKKPQVLGRLTDLKGLDDDHGSWYLAATNSCLLVCWDPGFFVGFVGFDGLVVLVFFVVVVWAPWFGLFGQENVVFEASYMYGNGW